MSLLNRQGGALLIGFVCALIANSGLAVAQTSTLPQGWSHIDVGSPVVAGSATGSGTSFTVAGAGTDIGGTSDEFQFVYQAVSGDVDIRVQVSSLQNVDPGAKAGIMIREELTDNAQDAFMYVSGGNGLVFQRRMKADGKAVEKNGADVAAPVWLRLVREGGTFTAYSSPTGATWTQVGSTSISMNAKAYVGLAVTSHVASKTASATFANLSFGGSSSSSSLPSPWATSDIGSPTISGSATVSGGTFTVSSAGQDIFETSDQFRFVYQQVSGDTQVVAYVGSVNASDQWSKAGVMIRADLSASAAEATTVITGSNGWQFDRRLVAGGASYDTNGSSGAAPAWIRIVREGNLFSSYSSKDGSQWTLIGTDTITMPSTVYVGLAVSSHNTAASATATYSNVAVTTPSSSNKSPTVSISAPAAGTTYTAPASMAISATAGDTDGSIAKVEFYAGSTLIGTDTSSPYSVSWSNVAAGTYSLTAVATDNAGAKTTSAAVSITVGTAATITSNLMFTPPTDYATNVTSLKAEVRRSTDGTSATPIATMNLGKPASTGGDITINISSIVDPLASGSYYTVVVATGPYGSTSSAASPAFTK